jgi:LysR family transcriptional regulator, hydrogen peroxide-inducible genes activator
MNLTLVQLEYILAVNKYRHFQTAADHCFVTQPTLSMQIKKLEESLGILIFDRSSQPVQPTPIGRMILEQAIETVSAARKIQEIAEEDLHEPSGIIHIGVLPTIGPYILPGLISALSQKYNIEFNFKELLTEEAIEQVRSGELDAAIVSTPLGEKGIDEIVLYYEPLWVFASANHPLLQYEYVEPELLQAESLWMLTEGHCFREQTLKICNQLQPANVSRFKYTTGSLEALIRIIHYQYGYTLLPHLATVGMDQAQRQCLRPFSKPAPKREVGIIVKSGHLKRRIITVLREEIINNLPQGLILETEDQILRWKD